MTFALDGATEHQMQHECRVHCSNARWLMRYGSGYIIEMEGILQAVCRTVPLIPPVDEKGMPILNNSESQGPGSSKMQTSSPSHLHSSPASNPSNPNSGPDPTSNSNPHQNQNTMGASPRPKGSVPYTVKIDEFSFDTTRLRKYIEADKIRSSNIKADHTGAQFGMSGVHDIPREPQNRFGLPESTVRMIELSEANRFLMPLMNYVDQPSYNGGPLRMYFLQNYIFKTNAGCFLIISFGFSQQKGLKISSSSRH